MEEKKIKLKLITRVIVAIVLITAYAICYAAYNYDVIKSRNGEVIIGEPVKTETKTNQNVPEETAAIKTISTKMILQPEKEQNMQKYELSDMPEYEMLRHIPFREYQKFKETNKITDDLSLANAEEKLLEEWLDKQKLTASWKEGENAFNKYFSNYNFKNAYKNWQRYFQSNNIDKINIDELGQISAYFYELHRHSYERSWDCMVRKYIERDKNDMLWSYLILSQPIDIENLSDSDIAELESIYVYYATDENNIQKLTTLITNKNFNILKLIEFKKQYGTRQGGAYHIDMGILTEYCDLFYYNSSFSSEQIRTIMDYPSLTDEQKINITKNIIQDNSIPSNEKYEQIINKMTKTVKTYKRNRTKENIKNDFKLPGYIFGVMFGGGM